MVSDPLRGATTEWLLQKKITSLQLDVESAKQIMLRFVGKVESGRARSVETYADMKTWLAQHDQKTIVPMEEWGSDIESHLEDHD